MDKFFREANKYVITIILVAFGILFLNKYLSGDELESQPQAMLWASVALIAVGLLAMPAVLERLNRAIYVALAVVGSFAAVYLAWAVFYSVDEEIQFQETKAEVQAVTIQRLKDIRDAQEAFHDIHGYYTNSFDSLAAFMNEPVLPVKYSMGSFHDTLPEATSLEEGYVLRREEVAEVAEKLGLDAEAFLDDIVNDASPYKVRDTLYTSFWAENFAPEKRAEKKLPAVELESLWYNPLTGVKFYIATDSVEVGGVPQSTILVKDMTPFGRDRVKKDTLQFGSLTDAHTDGNWRN
jgi:hypothetical protein